MNNVNLPTTYIDFFNGVLHGLQKHENATSECGGNIEKLQPLFTQLADLYKDFISGKLSPTKFMAFVNNVFLVMGNIEGSCHFFELLTDTIGLLNPVALVLRIAYIIVIGSWVIVPSSFYFIYYLFQGESYNSGLHIGRILKYVLSYDIE